MIAHIVKNEKEERVQTVIQHTYGVVLIGSEEGKKIGISNIVKLAALFHDMGKEKEEFEEYLYSQMNGMNKQSRGSVNHSSAGARNIFLKYHCEKASKKILTEIIAYAISAHHGLFDIVEESGFHKFSERLKEPAFYKECCENFNKDILCDYDVDQLFEDAYKEFLIIKEKIDALDKANSKFYYGCFQRFVLSILIDSDWSDTAAFVSDEKSGISPKFEDIQSAWNHYQLYMDKLQNRWGEQSYSNKQKQIMQLRNVIQKECIEFGKNPAGIYCLPIPTGGGKTLSGLGYALKYWKEHPETERIFYISPYISITEQNARVIKEAVGDSGWVLEHHSNVIQESVSNDEYEAETYAPVFINWNQPIICTTMVQFLNTLFSDRKQSIIRFHKLKNSVVIIDEVQSLPVKTIHTFNLMMNFLKAVCNTDIVLCTATQPQFAKTERPILYSTPQNMITDVTGRFEQFDRVDIISHLQNGAYVYEEIRDIIVNMFNERNSVLVILNTKYAVQMLYDEMNQNCDMDIEVEYLTTNLCAEHRSKKIDGIKQKLIEGKKKVLIISTNLIEAGVDISVECVIRSLAGLDSIAQAAGRCNRNGELEKGQVHVIQVENEKKDRMTELLSAIEATKEVLYYYEKEGGRNLLAPKWMNLYYELLFDYNAEKMDFNIKGLGSQNSIYQLLSNGFQTENKVTYMRQAYKTAGEKYNVIENDGVEVIVPYEKGTEFISQLEIANELSEIKKIIRKVQRYTVTIHSYKIKELEEKGVIRLCEKVPGVYIALAYDDKIGIVSGLIELIY